MRGRCEETIEGGVRVFVEFSAMDLVLCPLDRFDLMMLGEKPKSLADILLDAELIARRTEQRIRESQEAKP